MFTDQDHKVMAAAHIDLGASKCAVCDQYFIERTRHLQEIADSAELADSLADDVRQARLDTAAAEERAESNETKYRLATFALALVLIWAVCHGAHGCGGGH